MLVALQDKYRQQIQIIGISEDEGPLDPVKQFVAEHRINYPIVIATPEIERHFGGVSGLPTSFWIDRDGIGYSDYRDDVLKTDNRALDSRRGDREHINVATFGGHYLRVTSTASGPVDVLLWGAVQTGSWGSLAHRAGAVAAEIGWQPTLGTLAPWIRGGYNYGSGDGDPNDARHGTFFQLLPTPRVYARFPFFGMMNSGDAFGELIIRPRGKFTVRADVHALHLASRDDLWYLGGGAFQPATFGYAGRPSSGRSGLATLYDVSADLTLNPHVGVTGYYSHAIGKQVIGAIYPAGSTGQFGYLELLVRF